MSCVTIYSGVYLREKINPLAQRVTLPRNKNSKIRVIPHEKEPDIKRIAKM